MQAKIIHFAIFFLNFYLTSCQSSFTAWSNIGTGVYYRKNLNLGSENNILITYSGWQVTAYQSQTWIERLYSKSMLSGASYKMNHHYSVVGPKDTNYASLEIQNSKLIAHLYDIASISNIKLIVLVAHSSGSFVADEFFQQLYNKINSAIASGNTATAAIGYKLSKKIVYYNLDGAITPTNKATSYLSTLFSRIYFVWASKKLSTSTLITSMNSNSMISGISSYPSTMSKSIEISDSKSTCINGRCLHDVLIIEVPFDSSNFVTANDYTLFTLSNEVQFNYLTQTVTVLQEMLNAP